MRHHGDEDHDWDEFYTDEAEDGQVWSGEPNGSLVAEAADLPPGRALDVGCGEGADAIWLAERGWTVTAVDPSRVAVDRAEAAAGKAGVEVTWVRAGLADMPGGTGEHDLVSAQYPALRQTGDDGNLTALLGAVGPGGRLLFVHHADFEEHVAEEAGEHDREPGDAHGHEHEHRIDPDDYVMPEDVAARLGAGWEIEVNERRPRPGPVPPDSPHVDDVVLRARRSPAVDEA